ncbi:MAG: LOG family protein [Cyanobium sp.]
MALPGRGPLEVLQQQIEGHPQRRLIEKAVVALLEVAREEKEAPEWELISGCLADISEALELFRPHRGLRKISVFGSARTQPDDACGTLASELAARAVEAGFEVMTGAGGGVMEAANGGAGCEHSFGLNVDLPYEQHPNPYVRGCGSRLLHFRYFFTRKLFFLRESDALVVLPGGFGTLDELFESLTLIQTGRMPLIPQVLLAPPGDSFWSEWRQQLEQTLVSRGLISAEDGSLVQEACSAEAAVALISRFYRVFHSALLGDGRIELLLNAAIPRALLPDLNLRFADLLDHGAIQAGEACDASGILRPSLRLRFDRRRVGRLHQLIAHLNALDLPEAPALPQPALRCAVLSPA